MRSRFAIFLALIPLSLAGCGEKDEPEVAAPVAQAPTEPEQPAPGPEEPSEPEPEPAPEPEPRPGPDNPPPAPPRPVGQQIAIAVRGVLVSGDPDVACRQYATVRFLATSFGGLAGCRAATNPRTAADSVRLRGLVVNGSRARVVAIPSGGSSSGQRIRVAIVARGDRWRVDSLRSNVPVGP
jgi:hypothetical protein